MFGTGFQRTGTTSLNSALNILGIRSLDAPFALYENINDKCLDEYEGFTDNPVPLLYRELDKKFPGSRFIHTTRDTDEWLESVYWLFSAGKERFQWDSRPVINRIHNELYGTTCFDEKIFRTVYEKHNDDVASYFSSRPDDFLTIRITTGDRWEKICDFLNKKIPDQAFPGKNKSIQGE